MKFKFKNKNKLSITNVDKPEKENTPLAENVKNKKKKRKFPEEKSEENDVGSQSVKRSKKEKKVQPAVEENQSTEITPENDAVESQFVKKSKKKKKKNQPVKEENHAEEQSSQVISENSNVESQSAKKSRKKKKKNKSTVEENNVEEELGNEVISKSNEIESLFVEKSKKKKKGQAAIAENDAEEKPDAESISNNEEKDAGQKKDLTKNKTKNNKSSPHTKHLLPHQIKAERESRTIFIGNLPIKFKDKKFKKLIGEFGEIETVRIRGGIPECDKISKKVAVNKKMFNKDQQSLVAYVVFKTAQDAKNALNLNGQVFEDHHLRVTLPTEKTSDKNKGIFIGNLNYKITEENIWDFFKGCGEILSVRVIRDNQTGLCKGFGYVNFKSEDSVEFALKQDEEKLLDREIRIKRLFSDGKLEKLKKKKELSNIKNNTLNNKSSKFKKEKTTDKTGFNKKFKSKTENSTSDKPGFKFKKKNVNKVDLKKKKLAEKLMAKPKKKAVAST